MNNNYLDKDFPSEEILAIDTFRFFLKFCNDNRSCDIYEKLSKEAKEYVCLSPHFISGDYLNMFLVKARLIKTLNAVFV